MKITKIDITYENVFFVTFVYYVFIFYLINIDCILKFTFLYHYIMFNIHIYSLLR